MELISIFSVPLLFFIAIYFLVYKKDEKYLNAIGDQIRSHQMELRRMQIQMNSIHSKLQVIEKFSQSMRRNYQEPPPFPDEETQPGYRRLRKKLTEESSLAKLEKEITSIKEILNLADEDPF